MAIFQDVVLGWDGANYTIPAERVLGAIAEIEQVITLSEIAAYNERGTAPMAKLAQAFGAALRYAGAKVANDEVYAGLLRGGDSQGVAVKSVTALLQMMLPPASFAQKEAPRGNGRGVGTRSSKSATRPSSSRPRP
jgi:hypothetical protein